MAWISSCIRVKQWDVIIYPRRNSYASSFNGSRFSVGYHCHHDVYNARMAETYLATVMYVWPAAVDTLLLAKT